VGQGSHLPLGHPELIKVLNRNLMGKNVRSFQHIVINQCKVLQITVGLIGSFYDRNSIRGMSSTSMARFLFPLTWSRLKRHVDTRFLKFRVNVGVSWSNDDGRVSVVVEERTLKTCTSAHRRPDTDEEWFGLRKFSAGRSLDSVDQEKLTIDCSDQERILCLEIAAEGR